MENKFYVYCHIKKTDGKCFYIGKGQKNRKDTHYGRNKYWHNIVNKHGFESIILVNNISEEKAFELEESFCNQIGYENLCNLNQQKGRGHSKNQETKQQISNKRKTYIEKNGMPSTLWDYSDSRKEKASQTWKEIWEKDNGKIGEKISASKKGKKLNKDYKIHSQKISKPIICDTLFGMVFPSTKIAGEILNLNNGNICEVLKGNKIHAKGFVFRYLENQ